MTKIQIENTHFSVIIIIALSSNKSTNPTQRTGKYNQNPSLLYLYEFECELRRLNVSLPNYLSTDVSPHLIFKNGPHPTLWPQDVPYPEDGEPKNEQNNGYPDDASPGNSTASSNIAY